MKSTGKHKNKNTEKTVLQSDPFAQREAKKYKKPIPSREFITDYLSQYTKPFSMQQLSQAFQLTDPLEKEALRRRLRAMVRDGQLIKIRTHQYKLAKESNLIFGQVIGHKDGFGFLVPEDGTSHIFLSAYQMRKVFNGDSVTARIINIDHHNRREGQIVTVTERKLEKIVGRFFIKEEVGFVEPNNKRISQYIIIPANKQQKAKPGQIVVAKILEPPTEHSYAVAQIVEILGDFLSAGMEIEIATRSYALPYKWPKKVLKETSTLTETVSEKDKKNRINLRHLPFVTIDDETARDFDDAIYCEKDKKKGWHLYVAIADVSHYVKINSSIDIEAKERGTSVYFPGKVLPMLPEILSNNLCSLKPNIDRLCMVCDMLITSKGEVTQYQFYPAIINSHARLTYNKVNSILVEKNKTLITHYKELLPHIQELQQLYYALHQARQKRGALDLETPEFKIKFGPDKKISQLMPTTRHEAHMIVEECMLCANESAAKFLSEHYNYALYRVHDIPRSNKLSELRTFLKDFKLSLKGGDLPTSADYAKLLNQIKIRPDAHILQIVLMRSLSQAFYSPNLDKHFGLALDYYTHFTSPIRRYPDLTVHRAIRLILEKSKLSLDQKELETLANHCSMTERRADEATHEALLSLKCEYMLDKIGKEYTGIISGVTGFGLFVELQDIFIDGLLHISSLYDDHYIFEPLRHRLVGRETNKTYYMGDSLNVKVARVDVENREIELVLVD